MLERVLSLFERGVVALERIYGVLAPPGIPVQQPAQQVQAGTVGVGEALAAANHADKVAREALAEAVNFTASPAALEKAAQNPVPAPTVTTPPTRKEVGAALVDLATINRDEAVNCLKMFGGAQKLDQVSEADYPMLLTVINKTRAGLQV